MVDSAHSHEASPLLDRREEHTNRSLRTETRVVQAKFTPQLILPVAFLAALAMTSTASTSFYAYAMLLCHDPAHCKEDEQTRYAGTVAITASISNILGMLALGHLQQLSLINNKKGLLLWMATRSMSAVMLLLSVSTRSIIIALSGRIFEGIASDNLLHYLFNAIYSRSENQKTTSALIGYSMALYLVGISISPFLAGLFKNFVVSFFIALGLFTVTIAYLQVVVPPQTLHPIRAPVLVRPLRNFASTVMAPLQTLKSHPTSLLIGFSLLAYNVVQSYTFTALLVHTSTQFHFTGRDNGLLLSIAHSVAAIYIFLTLYAIPKIERRFWLRTPACEWFEPPTRFATRDAMLALVSQLIHVISLVGIGFSATAAQIYGFTAVLAFSLPIASFIKAGFVAHLEGEQKSKGLASLAAMETLGSVLGPMVLGGWQSYSVAGPTVFFVAAGIAAASMVSFGVGILAIGAIAQIENV